MARYMEIYKDVTKTTIFITVEFNVRFMMRKFGIYIVLFLAISSFAFAGTGRAAQTKIVNNLINSLNYNKYESFVNDSSPQWRKKMNRANYNKLHKQMIGYIGYIVSWKPVSKKTKGKIESYTYRLTGNSESIGLIMEVEMYVHNGKLVVNNVAFLKR